MFNIHFSFLNALITCYLLLFRLETTIRSRIISCSVVPEVQGIFKDDVIIKVKNRKVCKRKKLKKKKRIQYSLMPLFQSESECETIPMKMILICMKMELHAELIFALRFVLKQRHKRTRKWSIVFRDKED